VAGRSKTGAQAPVPGRGRDEHSAPGPLPRAFYARPTLEVARDLLGKVLVHDGPGGTTSGIIVETEAYIGESDPACHAAPGPTLRNRPLYGPPGIAYVYFNYGMHCLVNAVTEAEGSPAAVLLRALEPLDGITLMQSRRLAWMAERRAARAGRGAVPAHDLSVMRLCQGPGNLTRAMGITLADNLSDLTRSRLRIEERGHAVSTLAWGPRVGLRVGIDRHWRVYVEGHPAVSHPR
jgi:DNA-3-methyladenine glycosylase